MFSNSTKTFKNLISKYYRRKKETKVGKALILHKLEKNLQKLESEENDKEFIIKEVRKEIDLKKKILFTFGAKAIKHYKDFKNIRVKTKLDKNKFFNPLSNYNLSEPKTEKRKYYSKKYLRQKIIDFPRISEDKKIRTTINKYRSYSILKKLRNSLDFKKNDISEEQSKTYYSIVGKKNILTNSIRKKNKKDNSHHNFYRTLNNISLVNKKNSSKIMISDIPRTPLKTERGFTQYSNISFKKKNNFRFNQDYLNYLQTLRNEFTSEGKRNKKYYNDNKYGCDIFKLKYNFLRKNYFN